MTSTVRVWDLPTRLFHWALVFCVVSLAITAYRENALEWHAKLGYAVCALLLFRLVWGFIGGRWSRFASFFYSPASVMAYLRGQSHPDHLVGHNPLGTGSVIAMLVFLIAQVATGLVSDDESTFTGPLNRFVATSKGLAATWYHKRIGQWVLLALVVLHVGAIAFYLLHKKENLVRPMVSGDKAVDGQPQPSRDDAASRVLALAVFGACSAFVWWLVK
ncbi:cytochrome b/b6 domain-containing protein [Ramlibacter humi]|uniref:Cytochrome B n=1 Tax=Ramlibacter humi TaxID=2530451 RepID=A0A4Z0BGG4_9BURK|nr:cytochrome b/b6 domain-containing protein [Ramlibacter humi]TFY98405.1 cytochrome B [Ramlibacter humi]